MERRDLADRADVARLVESFYLRAFDDPRIGPIFTEVARMDLAHHLPIMCDFWETVLFQAATYRRNPFALHAALDARHPLGADDFEHWLAIWDANVDAQFAGPVAERAKTQARRIAASIRRRLTGRSGSALETLATRERLEREGLIDELG